MCQIFEIIANEYIKNQLKSHTREDTGKTLKFYRLYKKFSQNQLAKELNTNFQKIQKLENAKNRMTPELLNNICNILNIEVKQFIDSIPNCDLLLEILLKE